MKTNKGQIQQVFTYLVAIFIIGAVALIGAKSLFGIMDQKDQIDFVTFKEDVVNEIEDNNIYGTVNEMRLSAPAKMTQLCIVNSETLNSIQQEDNTVNFQISTGNEDIDFIVEDSVLDEVKTNIFVSNGKLVYPIGYTSKAVVNGDVTCINATNGFFNLKFKGQGRTTLVSGQ